jgi:hypothetical protein
VPANPVLAVELLYDGIIAQLTDDFSPEPCPIVFGFGFREPAMQSEGVGGANRIVFVPGDRGARFARDLPPRNPGRDPRSLGTKDEFVTVHIWAADATDLTNERLQYRACRLLYDAFFRAVYLVSHSDGDVGVGPVSFVDESWDADHIERGYGYVIIAVLSVAAMVPDVKYESDIVTATTTVEVQGVVQVLNS